MTPPSSAPDATSARSPRATDATATPRTTGATATPRTTDATAAPRSTRTPRATDATDTGRGGYHHGDLRRALVESGLELLDSEGLDAVTLRAVARKAGVSHAAPYHHFTDKAALIEALAVEGQHRLAAALTTGRESVRHPLERMQRVGVAYIGFAVARPALFGLMNRPELRAAGSSAVAEAARTAYAVLESSIEDCRRAGLLRTELAPATALTAWATVHGLTVLLLDGLIPGERPTMEAAERLATQVTATLGTGLFTDPA